MITSKNDNYILLLSHDPCDLFRYFDTENLHGLNLKDCEEYKNTPDDSYIAGMCNIEKAITHRQNRDK